MSKGLENFTNANPVTADYPWKDIKDNTGANDGTPVDRDHHADYHQTFRKLLALASITPNGLPDNVTNGYQYVDALDVLYKNYIGFIGASADTTFTAADINKVVLCSGATIGVVHTLPLGSTLRDGDCITFVNAGSGTVSVVENVGNTIFYNPGTMRTNDYIKLVYSSVLGAWVAISSKVTVIGTLTANTNWNVPSTEPVSGTVNTLTYVLRNNRVYLKGWIQNTNSGATVLCTTLPVGAWPIQGKEFYIGTYANGYGKRLNIDSVTGQITISGITANTDVCLDSISFNID